MNLKDENADFLSVIVPVYNVESYLDACIQSILSQDYYNFELILIDDGSSDNSGNICDHWEQCDKRVKVIHKSNNGVCSARNTGVEKSIGDVIIFLDADDVIEPDMFADMLHYLKVKKVDCVCCGYTNEYSDSVKEEKPDEGILTGKEFAEGLLRPDIFSAIWNKAFKKEVLIDENGDWISFPVGLFIGEDFVWLTKIAQRCNKIYCIHKAYYHWIRRFDSATGEKEERFDYKAMSEVAALEIITNYYRDISDAAYYQACRKYYGCLMAKIKSPQLKHHSEAARVICEKLTMLVREYPVHSLREFFGLWRTRLMIWLLKLRGFTG